MKFYLIHVARGIVIGGLVALAIIGTITLLSGCSLLEDIIAPPGI